MEVMNELLSGQYDFVNEEFLYLLLLIPCILVFHIFKRNSHSSTFSIGNTSSFSTKSRIFSRSKPWVLLFFKLLALASIIVAVARPRTTSVTTNVFSDKGVEIVITLDLSASMMASDFSPNRLEATKKVAMEFVEKRKTDRIGVVIYAGEGFTLTPVTTDKRIIIDAIKDLKYNNIEKQGTAIGVGLATAINRLKESKAKSKVIILLTDGVNNVGNIDPLTVGEIAKNEGIKVYSIGVGKNGFANTPVAIRPNGELIYEYIRVEIDEKVLKEVSKITGGKYFRATDKKSLRAIYNEIDSLEKTEFEEFKYYQHNEKFRPFAILGLIFIGFYVFLYSTIYRGFI